MDGCRRLSSLLVLVLTVLVILLYTSSITSPEKNASSGSGSMNDPYHEKWKKRESRELSDIVQTRIKYIQNPVNCTTARKLLCIVVSYCGYGCQLHHILRCFIMAHGTNRTVIIHGVSWMQEFLPISETCTDSSSLPDNANSSQVIPMDTGDASVYTTPPKVLFIPPYIPADLATRLKRFHGHPFAWWAGQFFKYLLRPRPGLAADMEKAKLELGFQSPIVGMHVRRTDKLEYEAKLHPLSEYMSCVDRFYRRWKGDEPRLAVRSDNTNGRRRVYLATDEPEVLTEALNNYTQYNIVSNSNTTRNWKDSSRRSIIIDVHLLSMCDFLVCTFSSNICRLVYAIMQSLHVDATDRLVSLDSGYYFHGFRSREVAKVSHKAVSADQIDLQVGDVIQLKEVFLGSAYITGTNTRTNKTGQYLWSMSRPEVQIADYPVYPERGTVGD